MIGVAMVGSLGAGLVACSNGGAGLARQACSHIDRSIALYQQSTHQSDPRQSAALAQQAYLDLREALPLAAAAASNNGQWQALMTTVSESNRVAEAHLLVALRAQCAMANNTTSQLPPIPTTIPPPTVPATS